MKKLVLLLAVVFGVSLFSCNNASTETATEATEAPATVEATTIDTNKVANDSNKVANDSNKVAEVPAEAAK